MTGDGTKIKGLILGIVTGLLVTIFDGCIIVNIESYVPYNYPIILFVFNILFWAGIGGISGVFISLFIKESRVKKNENFFWALIYLVPFALIYGVLGRIPIPHIRGVIDKLLWPEPVYDYHLSFVWIAFILCFLLFKLKKTDNRNSFSPLLLSVEIAAIIIIYQFCSNPVFYPPYYDSIKSFFVNYLKIPASFFNMLFYVFGVLCIAALYFFVFFRIRPGLRKRRFAYQYSIVFILFFLVCGFLYSSYLVSQRTNARTDSPLLHGSLGLQKENKAPNVILIVLDTVRADRLSVYDKNIRTSKNLEDFARDSLVFEQCIAPSSWTGPSHASLFTGLYVSEHKSDSHFSQPPSLNERCVTLAEIFRDYGYKTAAVVSNVSINLYGNFFQGFQFVDSRQSIGIAQRLPFRPLLLFFSYVTNSYPKCTKPYRTADDINRHAINVLNAAGNEPLFLFLNYMDTHIPNVPPKPFNNDFLNKKYPRFYGLQQYVGRLRNQYDKNTWDTYLRSQYDGEIAYLDHELGELFSYLKRRGMYDSSLIIITSDHGELLGEHGIYEHRCQLYEGAVKVPLIIKFPYNKRVGRESKPINLTDVYSTTLRICDLPVPDNISGEAFGGPFSQVSELYSDTLGEHKIIYDGNYKYMEYSNIKSAAAKKSELYDLTRDPQEKENLIDVDTERAAAMHMKLESWKKHRKQGYEPAKTNAPVSEELKKTLKSLGYVQ